VREAQKIVYSNQAPLVEHVAVQDIFVSGLARIDDIGGGNLRFTFFTKQRSSMFLDERTENVVTLRIVMHAAAACDGSKASLCAVSEFPGFETGTLLDFKRSG
jgi:hypothetical protein